MMMIFGCMVFGFYAVAASNESQNVTNANIYEPDWNDLDFRPLPSWYDAAKIGIIIHWGIYSVPSFLSGEWFWYDLQKGDLRLKKYMEDNYKGMRYQDFATRFDAALFYPNRWAELFAYCGAKYVVITAKHHDGFALFPSGRSNWNSVDVGPRIDIVGALSKAVKKHKMKFGIYYSLLEWFNKLFLDDKGKKFTSTNYTDKIIWPDLKFLVTKYKPSLISADGSEVAFDTYWKSKEFLAWLYNESPVKNVVVVNDRWGKGTDCRHGGFYNCKSRYKPMRLMPHKWENVFSLDRKSWGYRRDMQPADVLSIEELLKIVVTTVSCGGNALISIGPRASGSISPIFVILLKQLGEWLTVNGESIYNTTPCFMQNDKINLDVWYTCNKDGHNDTVSTVSPNYVTVSYAIFLKWPTDDILRIRNVVNYIRNTKVRIELLKSVGNIKAKHKVFANDVVEVELPGKSIEAFTYAWVLKISRSHKLKKKSETKLLMMPEERFSPQSQKSTNVSSLPEECSSLHKGHFPPKDFISLEENFLPEENNAAVESSSLEEKFSVEENSFSED